MKNEIEKLKNQKKYLNQSKYLNMKKLKKKRII